MENIIAQIGGAASLYVIAWGIFCGICESFFSNQQDLLCYRSIWLQRLVRFTGLIALIAVFIVAICNTYPITIDNALDLLTVLACWAFVLVLVPFFTMLLVGLIQFMLYKIYCAFLAAIRWAWNSPKVRNDKTTNEADNETSAS
ncbi:MAG: hypothetical protein IJ852_00950 [Alphaproteobacteria bacterium]|nr:hypothetical protein [Alphaproteobacteria bacterium]